MQIFLEVTVTYHAGKNIEDCSLTSQKLLTLSILIRKVKAPNFDIWNTYGLLPCNRGISLDITLFFSLYWVVSLVLKF